MWKPVYDGVYEVSEFGDVRRVRNLRKDGTVRASTGSSGYTKVTLFPPQGRTTVYVHRLVAGAFIGPCPDGLVVNHLDGNKLNNHFSNLEYTTYGGNSRHASNSGLLPTGLRHGRHTHPERTARGERGGRTKVTEGQVIAIREARANGSSVAALALEYGLCKSGICAIVNRINWKHVA